ncbi:MAG: hypothetical protein U9O18_00680 [Chloroflexota bacterium]|nr:hypothetical protein [Chloroflexota bacterium]
MTPKESEMDARLTALLGRMLDPLATSPGLPILDPSTCLVDGADDVVCVSAAFLVTVAGPGHPDHERAAAILAEPPRDTAGLAAFYRAGLDQVDAELARVFASEPAVAMRWDEAIAALDAATTADDVAEAAWRAFFPQAFGIRGHEEAHIRELRAARTVTIEQPAADPITDPAREVLFTSNVLLTIPDASTDIEALPYPADLREAIRAAAEEPQRSWFDHPIQIGVEPAANELLYGLRGLDAAVGAEPDADRVTCLLSVSVTHDGLAPIAGRYVEAELARDGRLQHLDVVVVTEDDTRRLIDEVLVPALGERGVEAASGLHRVVGVDGHYGRHYSFLKAVAALWSVVVDPAVRATFKIDLDQVFPQAVLRAQTGKTMFEHLCTPLWGATAHSADGRELELGMLAGALVNERDIDKGLFTPDVPIPERLPTLDEHVFFSGLPQAISTRAEMMERYDGAAVDGVATALERIHVTGGTNGIRVDALRRHRPFTPTWVGRAEDQAYLLSALGQPGRRLAYAHAAGLIMRHDKAAFAGRSMAAAHVGKLIGDDVRILVFSAYLDAIESGGGDIHALLDPFTGCFASAAPRTLVLLRLALRTLRLFAAGTAADAREYATDGSRRVAEAFETHGDPAVVAIELEQERAAWDDYYDALEALEDGPDELRQDAAGIIEACRVVVT